MEFNTAFIILGVAYALELCVLALDGAYFALVGEFDKRKFLLGATREVGFALGIFVLLVGSIYIPSDLILISIGNGSVGMGDVASILLVAFLTCQIYHFIKSANDLKGLKMDELKED